MRDPELVARAQRAAARLESAWEQWRALHGLAVTPSQPVVSYVGYSLTEPWGEPRVVIGVDADEAEFLAEFLDRDECASLGQLPAQQVTPHQEHGLLAELPQPQAGSPSLKGTPVPRGREVATELAGWSSGELPGQASEQLAGWHPKVPQQLTPQQVSQQQLTPPGMKAAADQPPGAA